MRKLLSVLEVAEMIGCSRQTVSRAALRIEKGIYAGGRLVAVEPDEVKDIMRAVHPGPGNPGQRDDAGRYVGR